MVTWKLARFQTQGRGKQEVNPIEAKEDKRWKTKKKKYRFLHRGKSRKLNWFRYLSENAESKEMNGKSDARSSWRSLHVQSFAYH